MILDALDLRAWDALDADACEVIARDAVEPILPAPFRFDGVGRCELGDQRRFVAFFDRAGARFVLVPGGAVTLGYDRDRPWVPDEDEAASWADSEESFGISLADHLDQVLSPLREVTLAPFLIEVEATNPGLRRVRRQEVTPGVGVVIEGRDIYEERPVTHGQAVALAAADGLRLPTSDEWEHACAAGARTLFRWGDHSPDEAEETAGLVSRPNAFGLRISQDSYKWEAVAEPGLLRGGDGGESLCGGYGHLYAWLTLAPAYLCRYAEGPDDDGIYGLHVRRVLPLG